MTENEMTARMKPLLSAIERATGAIQDLLDDNPMVPFEISDEQAEALRWLQENIIV